MQGKRSLFLRLCILLNAKCYNLILLLSLTLLLACSGKRFDNPFDPKNRPAGPREIFPADGAEITDNPPALSWAAIAESAYYHIQVDEDSLFSSPLMNDSLRRDTTFHPSESFPYGRIYWRIRCAKVKGAWGSWSGRHKFFCKYGVVYNDPTLTGLAEIEISANRAYILHSGFDIYDLTIPTRPQLLGHYDNSNAYKMKVVGNVVYLLTYEGILYKFVIVDASNPASPTIESAYSCTTALHDMAISGSTVILKSCPHLGPNFRSSLLLLDISNPRQPSLIGRWDTLSYDFQDLRGLAAKEGWVYAIMHSQGLGIFDCHNPSAPRHTGSLAGINADKLLPLGSRLYTGGRAKAIKVLSLLDPSSPSLLADLSMYGWSADYYVNDDTLYRLGINRGYLDFYDLSNLPNSTTIGGVQLRASFLAVSGDYAYVTSSNGLSVMRVR